MSGETEKKKAKKEPKTARYRLVRGRFIDESGKLHKPGDVLTLPVEYAEGRNRFELAGD
jgi:hypothetical protein